MDGPATGRRVLVVEDEVLVSWIAQDLLADMGCVVIGPAASVDQALEVIATMGLDAAVLDINLNGQMSYPVADELIARGVPFVFATGYDRGGIPERYQRFSVLQKPLMREALRQAMSAMAYAPAPSPEAPIGGAPDPEPG